MSSQTARPAVSQPTKPIRPCPACGSPLLGGPTGGNEFLDWCENAHVFHLDPQPKQKFNREFIDRRMQEHRDWQRARERQLAAGIIREVLGLEDSYVH